MARKLLFVVTTVCPLPLLLITGERPLP